MDRRERCGLGPDTSQSSHAYQHIELRQTLTMITTSDIAGIYLPCISACFKARELYSRSACYANSVDHTNLRNAHSRHPCNVVKNSSKMVLLACQYFNSAFPIDVTDIIWEHLCLIRQRGASRFDEVDARQSVFESNLLSSQVLLHLNDGIPSSVNLSSCQSS